MGEENIDVFFSENLQASSKFFAFLQPSPVQ